MTQHAVTICEVGPRDGLQMARGRMATDVKLRWIAQLAAAGLKEIEVGSFVSPRMIPQMADTGEVVRGALAIDGLTVCALACNLKGAIAAHEAGAHVLAIPISVSNTHSHANVNKSTDDQVEMVRSIVGTLVEVGLGRRTAGQVSGILRARDRGAAGQLAPPLGLCLWQVRY